jgi:S1-C subfamily serine protease
LLKIDATDLPVAKWSERPLKPGTIVASVGSAEDALIFGAVCSPVQTVPAMKGRLPFSTRAAKPPGSGVQIRNVWAEHAITLIVRDGDLLTQVEDREVPTIEEYLRVTTRLLAGSDMVDGKQVRLTINRDGKSLPVKVPLQPNDNHGYYFPELRGRRSGFPAAFLHDAWVPRGRGASVVVDVEGKVIGINLATLSFNADHNFPRPPDAGLTYAIPANVVRKVIAELGKWKSLRLNPANAVGPPTPDSARCIGPLGGPTDAGI